MKLFSFLGEISSLLSYLLSYSMKCNVKKFEILLHSFFVILKITRIKYSFQNINGTLILSQIIRWEKIQTTKYKFAQILSFHRPQNIVVERNPFDSIFRESLISRSVQDITKITSKFLEQRFCFIKNLDSARKIDRFWNRFDF